MLDDPDNADDETMCTSSCSENNPSEEKEMNVRESQEVELSNNSRAEKSSSSPPSKFTDTDPATGLVRNVRAVMSQKASKANILTGRSLRDMTGHTGYLTFATLYAQCDK